MRSAVLLLALVAAAAAVPAGPRRRIRVIKPVRLPLSTHHRNDETARDLEVLVPQEPIELRQVQEQPREIIRPVRESSGGFTQELPSFAAGSPLPDAPQNEGGFFVMPAGFPSIGSLGGFGDSFDRSDSEINNIEVIPIQFPSS